MDRTPDLAVARLAATQLGLVSCDQAREMGLTRGEVRWRVRTGRWQAVGPTSSTDAGHRRGLRVFLLAGSPRTWHVEVLAAVLATGRGAVASHATAATLLGLLVPEPPQLEVTVPEGRRPRTPGVTVHASRLLTPSEVLTVHAVPCTRGERTVLDLAGRLNEDALTALLDDGISAGVVRRRALHRRTRDLGHRRAATDLLARLTAPGAAARFRSGLERTASRRFEEAGLPPPAWNVIVSDDDGVIGEVDALWPWARLIVELDGLRFHAAEERRRRDRARDRRLQLTGHLVLRFTWQDVRQRPEEMVAQLRRGLSAGG